MPAAFELGLENINFSHTLQRNKGCLRAQILVTGKLIMGRAYFCDRVRCALGPFALKYGGGARELNFQRMAKPSNVI
jgi:hypothetical protein